MSISIEFLFESPLFVRLIASPSLGCDYSLRPVHTVRFFLIATAIPSITRNGLHRTQWKCSHYATATTSPTPMQPIVSKNKSQSQIAQCERALNWQVNVA